MTLPEYSAVKSAQMASNGLAYPASTEACARLKSDSLIVMRSEFSGVRHASEGRFAVSLPRRLEEDEDDEDDEDEDDELFDVAGADGALGGVGGVATDTPDGGETPDARASLSSTVSGTT